MIDQEDDDGSAERPEILLLESFLPLLLLLFLLLLLLLLLFLLHTWVAQGVCSWEWGGRHGNCPLLDEGELDGSFSLLHIVTLSSQLIHFLYCKLNSQAEVDVLDKLPIPFGLIRYGVAPDHGAVKVMLH